MFKNNKIWPIIYLIIFAILMVGFFQLRKLIPPGLSYFTITLTNFIGSATVFFPLSGMAMLCTSISEIGLNPFIISGLSGAAESLGEIFGYGAGTAGRKILFKESFYNKLENLMQGKKLPIFIFFFALIPNPFFDIIGIISGTVRYPLKKFLPVIFIGKFLKFLIISYTCIGGYSFLANN